MNLKFFQKKQYDSAGEQPQGLKPKIKEAIKDWCMASTSHGIPNIARNESIYLKLMWAICFCISSGYCCYSIYVSVINYLEFGTNTQIETAYAYPLEFPAVTICNFNMFTTDAGIAFSKQVLAQNGVDDPVSSKTLAYLFNYTRMEETVNVYFAFEMVGFNANQLNNTAKQTLGYSKDQFVVGIVFNNTPQKLTILKWYFHFNYGNCFQFNTGYDESGNPLSILSTSKTGLLNGLRMFLFVGTQDNVNTLSFFHGARIFIHNRTQVPTVTDGVTAPAGLSTELTISKTTQTLLPEPYNDCYDNLNSPDLFDSFFYKQTFQSTSVYRQSDCLNLCVQDYIIKACNCSDPTWPNLYNTTYCSSVKETICAYRSRSVLFLKKIDLFNTFYDYCPLECGFNTYSITTSTGDFPTRSFAAVLANNSIVKSNLASIGEEVNYDSIKRNFAWVNIYYDRNTYTAIGQTPQILITDLMSNIGGTMGLYIGISFLSFVEVFEIIIQLLVLVYTHSKNVKVSSLDNSSALPAKA